MMEANNKATTRPKRRRLALLFAKPREKSRLSFWKQVGEKQEQINTDWHEKERPRRRRRRNVLPDAYPTTWRQAPGAGCGFRGATG